MFYCMFYRSYANYSIACIGLTLYHPYKLLASAVTVCHLGLIINIQKYLV